jgi:ATP-binding cassette subfamily G (WHITE) protein 2
MSESQGERLTVLVIALLFSTIPVAALIASALSSRKAPPLSPVELLGPPKREQPLAVLSWQLSCSIAGKAGNITLLDRVSGCAGPLSSGEPGCGLFAIMGSSGCGKTTLLDVLAGRKGPAYAVQGLVLLNGAPASARERQLASGYVTQSDVLPGTSTVLEFLTFHAALRLPRSLSASQRRQRVQHTLAQLGLAHLANATIGNEFRRGLSGGERRRVSIAAELVTSPLLLFCDEATTGLDSTNAARVVDILASLSANGVTALLSIHQPRPDIFRLLSRVLLLSAGGRTVFSGAASRAEAHFASLGHPLPAGVNIADWMLDTVLRAAPEEADRMVAAFEESKTAAPGPADAAQASELHGGSALLLKHRPGFLLQLRVLSGRLLRNAYRHPLLFWLSYGATALVALAVCAVFRHTGYGTAGIQSRLGVLFFLPLFLCLISLGSLPVWHEEQLLFLHDRATGAYGTAAYFTAVVAFDVVLLRLLPPLFFLAPYCVIGLRPSSAHAACFALLLMLVSVAANSLCMAIGALAPSNASATVAGSVALLTATLFGGFLVQNNDLPGALRWLAALSPLNRAFGALVVNEMDGVGDRFYLDASYRGEHIRYPTGDPNFHSATGGCTPPCTQFYAGVYISKLFGWERRGDVGASGVMPLVLSTVFCLAVALAALSAKRAQ